jgi:glycerophosphoryl diester phosphodiesterase
MRLAMNPPLLLGHRGASKYAPENTIAAFDLALAHGCDGFEFDVRFTRDARAVICHDPQFQNMEIAASEYAHFRASRGLELACADEVVRRYAPRSYLDIELKVEGELGSILAALAEAPRPDSFVISSFIPEVLLAAYARVQGLPLALICETRQQLSRWQTLPLAAVAVQHRLASPSLIEELHAAGKKVFVWTVNQAPEMRRFAELGADALISDDTQLLARTLHQQ